MRGNTAGWLSPEIIGAAGLGIAAMIGFVAWELRTATPMVPMRFFRNRAFAAANAASLAMYFGMFGSVFLLTQFLQLVLGYSPLQAGIRTLAWTAMPLFIAPAAGALSDRIGGRPIMAFGLALDAIAFNWIAYNAKVGMCYGQLLPALLMAGIGTASFLAPVANVVMGAVRPEEAGQASGAANPIREIGGVLGIAVLAAVFSARGGYATPRAFVDGFVPALTIGAITVAIGAAAALLIPPLRRGRRDAEAGSGSRLMSRSRKSSTADQVFGKVPSGAGSYSRTDGSGECDPVVVEGSSRAGALTRSARSTAAATATDTAQAPLPLEPWAPTIRSTHPRSSGRGTHRFSRTGGNHGRVA